VKKTKARNSKGWVLKGQNCKGKFGVHRNLNLGGREGSFQNPPVKMSMDKLSLTTKYLIVEIKPKKNAATRLFC